MNNLYKIEDNKIFAKKLNEEFEELPALELEDSLSFYQNEFVKFESEANKIFDKIDATENKGSYLAKILLLVDAIKVLDAVGDFQTLNDKLQAHKTSISEGIEQNRLRNAEIKQSLIASLSQIIDENNWRAIDEVKEIHQKWIRVGKASEKEDQELNAKFEELRVVFFNQKKEFFESQKELIESRVQLYREIIIKIEDLTKAKDLKANRPQVDKLIEDWKNNGPIPKSSYDPLFLLYKKSLDLFFDKIKQVKKSNYPSNDQNKEILALKKVVLDKMRVYLQETSRFDTKSIHHFKDEWNKAGKIHGKILGKIGDEFYGNLEYMYEFANLQNFQEKKSLGLDNASMIKTLKRFISENENEIEQFRINQEQMQIKLSSSNINTMFAKRLMDLEKKLLAKKKILLLLENK